MVYLGNESLWFRAYTIPFASFLKLTYHIYIQIGRFLRMEKIV
jgi:hypothetical protein